MASTSTRDFASAGASAAMREKRLSRAGLQLVKTVSRATESAKDGDVSVTQAREVRRASVSRQGPGQLDPEQGAFETVNYVLRTLGNRIGSAGLVSLPSLDRALTSATAAVLFSAEASPLFESLREKAHDLILVNSVFCAIYFIGFVTVRLAGTLPNWKGSYSPVGSKVIEQFMKAALGEDVTKQNEEANRAAYRTLSTAIDLLHPERSGPGIFPGFPKLDSSLFSSTGFLTVRENKNLMEKLVNHFSKHGFPQPSMNEEPERGRGGPPQDQIAIKDWRFLTGDDNSKQYDVAHADKHIGENFGRVVYWLICSAYRLTPGQAVIVYHQQHIQLVRWLGDRFGYKVLGMVTDLDWSGKHFDVSPKLKTMVREWLVIVPSPYQRQKRRSRHMTGTSHRSNSEKRSDVFQMQEMARIRSNEMQDVQPTKANTKEIRRPHVRPGRSVSFAEGEPVDIDEQSSTSGSSGMQPLQRVTTPLRSAIKRSGSLKADSPPRPARPAEEDIPDMNEVNNRTGDIPPPPYAVRDPSADAARRSVVVGEGASAHGRTLSGGSQKALNMNAGLPPFVSDMTSSRTSPSNSQRSSRSFERSGSGHGEVATSKNVQSNAQTSANQEPQDLPLTPQRDLARSNTISSNGDISNLPGAMFVMQTEQQQAPPIPTKSPRRTSPVSTPPPASSSQANPATSYYDYSENLPSINTASLAGAQEFEQLSPEMAAHWENNGQADFGGISNALIRSRQGSNENMAAAAAQNHDDPLATTPKAQSAIPVQHDLTASSVSSVSAAPSWPSSIASVPSSIPDTPTRSGYIDELDTAATSMTLEHSNSRLRRKAPPPPQKSVPAVALYDFESEDPEEELPFKKGDALEIIERNEELEEDGWCKARLNGRVGIIPLAYIEIVPPATALSNDGPRTEGVSTVGDDSVSLWSGFAQVIGWTRFKEYQARTENMGWNDVDPSEFDDNHDGPGNNLSKGKGKEQEPRSRSNSTLRTAVQSRLPEYLDPGHLTSSLETSPLPSRALSEYENSSVSGSAAPDPLFALSKAISHTALREDDTDLTPTDEYVPNQPRVQFGNREYFGTAESISGDTDISESESRIASFEVRARNDDFDDTDAATIVGSQTSSAPAPRFWDDISGGVTATASVSGRTVRSNEDWTDLRRRPDDVRSESGETVRSDQAPRFWDDVHGGVGTDPNAHGCRQS